MHFVLSGLSKSNTCFSKWIYILLGVQSPCSVSWSHVAWKTGHWTNWTHADQVPIYINPTFKSFLATEGKPNNLHHAYTLNKRVTFTTLQNSATIPEFKDHCRILVSFMHKNYSVWFEIADPIFEQEREMTDEKGKVYPQQERVCFYSLFVMIFLI